MSRVSAIIVTWNKKDLLAACLDSLRTQTRPADEIFVVDNGSTDGSRELVRDYYPDVALITLDHNTGFAYANNVAIQQATGDYIALLNNDLVLEPTWVKAMAAALEANTSLGSCASKMLLYHQRDTIDSAGIDFLIGGTGRNRAGGLRDAFPFDQPGYVFGACAGAAIYRRSMLREIGSFDETLNTYYEDVDLAFRAQLAGYDCLYIPEAVAYHHHGASSDSRRRDYFLARNSLLVLLKNMPGPLLRRYALHLVWSQLGYALSFARRGHGPIYARGRRHALRQFPDIMRARRAIQGTARRRPDDLAARLA